MHNSSLVAIAQYFGPIRTSVLYGNRKKFNTEAVNDYPPIRFEIRFEGKFPIRRSLARQSVMAGRDKQYVTCDMHVQTNVSPVGILVMLSFC